MPVVAVIPVKSFSEGKGRLATVLDDDGRRRLSIRLAEHVAMAAEEADVLPLIVTSDPDVAQWATSAGFPTLADPGTGLDDAAATGVEWANRARSSWLVLHADLPLLSARDVSAVVEHVVAGQGALAPSSDGGTSAVGGRGEFDFSYGPSSFHRHLQRLPGAQIVVRPGLALDVDSPADLETLAHIDAGRWLAAEIR